MSRLQKGDILAINACDWHSLICVRLLERPCRPIIEIKFSRLVIGDDKITIEGSRGSKLIYASLLKIANCRWLVDEVFYQ